MSGGLGSVTSGGHYVQQPAPQGPDYAPESTESPSYPGSSGESHLDSFFRQSSWSREDVSLLLDVASVLILLYWAHTEVSA